MPHVGAERQHQSTSKTVSLGQAVVLQHACPSQARLLQQNPGDEGLITCEVYTSKGWLWVLEKDSLGF